MANITGTSGPDSLTGTDQADVIAGLDGDDVIDPGLGSANSDASAGMDLIDGGDGVDTLNMRFDAFVDLRYGGDFAANTISGFRGHLTSIEGVALRAGGSAYGGRSTVLLRALSTDPTVATNLFMVDGSGRIMADGSLGPVSISDLGNGAHIISTGLAADTVDLGTYNSDTILYTDLKQSTPGSLDRILDFYQGRSVLDLSNISGSLVLIEHLSNSQAWVSFAPDAQGNRAGAISVTASVTSEIQITDIHVSTPTQFDLRGYNSPGSMDKLQGGNGADIISSGTAGANIIGGAGGDTLKGNSGIDIFYYGDASDSTLAAPDHITGFTSFQDAFAFTSASVDAGRLRMTYDNNQTFIDFGAGAGDAYAGHVVVDGSSVGPDLRPSAGIFIQDGDYADLLIGASGADVISGGGRDDVIQGALGPDTLTGGGGRDLFRYTLLADSRVGAGDTITDFQTRTDAIDVSGVDGGKVILTFGDYKTYVHYAPDSNGAYQGLIAVAGDVVAGYDLRISGSLTINDGDYSDPLIGGVGNDVISGAGGNDRLEGSYGADTLTGGSGADVFRYTDIRDSLVAARDVITDFNPAEGDVIDLSVIDANPLTLQDDAFVVVSAYSRHPGEAVLNYYPGQDVTMLGLDVDGDGAPDFQLAIDGHANANSGFIF